MKALVRDTTGQPDGLEDGPASFTLGEAADRLAVRADDLAATLDSAGIDLNTRAGGRLTREDVEHLKRGLDRVKQFGAESEYGSGSL